MYRRNFIKKNSLAAMALTSSSMFSNMLKKSTRQDEPKSFKEYLLNSAVPKKELDVFLNKDSWAQFDSEVGYIMGNYMPHDGMDNSSTISTVMPDGRRTNSIYSNNPCRINTYGNSFTQCHQVSDAETWQEYLAGHLGEPVQNFGMGGFGVYQAYKRLLRREKQDQNSKYVILYMWGDDYVRSGFRCRYTTYYTRWNDYGGYMFHGNFWSNIEMNLETGELVELKSRIDSKEDVYKMSDPEFMYENLKDDLMLQLHLLSSNMVNTDVDVEGLNKLADIINVPRIDFSSIDKMMRTSEKLKYKYSFLLTKYILKKTKNFCQENGKSLLLVHFDPYRVFMNMARGESRFDQEIIDFIKENGFNFFDMNEIHLEDFKKFNLTLEEYMNRYFIGHYNPSGNHFFAYSIKNTIVDWLDPKPISYQNENEKLIRFKGYLQQ